MFLLDELELAAVCGGNGKSASVCPPGMSPTGVTISQTVTVTSPSTTAGVGMSGPLPQGSVSTTTGTTSTSTTTTTNCEPTDQKKGTKKTGS